MSGDAVDMITPQADGAVRAMRAALRQAGLDPRDIGYVNAHGTGTQVNDRVEAQALEQVFGRRGVAVSATKSAHGHLIGAAGAVEALACLLALNEGLIAPTVGDADCDQDLGVDLVSGGARQAEVEHLSAMQARCARRSRRRLRREGVARMGTHRRSLAGVRPAWAGVVCRG